MAAPNIVNVSTITGKTATANLTTTDPTLVVENPASSGKVFKINSIFISNVDTTDASKITINIYSEDALGGSSTEICRQVVVPLEGTLVLIDKSSAIYLEEDKSIGAVAQDANKLKVICSYEEIS